MTAPLATAADIKAMAEKQPESGFNAETGELRIGDTIYRPRRYTRELRVAHKKLRQQHVPLEKQTEVSRITAKYKTDDAGKITGMVEPLTPDEAAFMDGIADLQPDLPYHTLALLFRDDQGEPPSVEDAMRYLVDEEASDAEDWVTENPTGRKTAKSSA
jgi:hypothetical protein